MFGRHLFHLSLAAKCRLLFGFAVALIIASALFVPWRSLENFVHDRNARRARTFALLARAQLDPASKDWVQQQVRLNQWWNDNWSVLRLPEGSPPRLIRLPQSESPRVTQEELLAQVETTQRLLRPPLAIAERWLRSSSPVQTGEALWASVSEELRTRIAAKSRSLGRHAARLIAGEQLLLDEFQLKTVRMFQGQAPEANPGGEIAHDAWRTEKARGKPTTYRYILAVRGSATGSGQLPLLGIIDVKLEATDTNEVLLWTRVMIVLAGLCAGLLAILVFYLIVQKFILAPVRELTVLAEEIADGDFRARADIATGDEFQELANAFNDMLGRLERARVELETINKSLDTRLGELAQRNVALFEANRLKSEFLANVSHELRTPLTSIIGFADLLRDITQSDGPVDKARGTRFAHNILTSGRNLLDLINDLLDLAKIEAGRVELHRTRFSLLDICEALDDFMRPLADKKQLTLTVDLSPDLPVMHSDAGKLRQILYNLLSNAVKYTPEGGQVRLTAVLLPNGSVQLSVADTGPGIAPEDQGKIFEKFRQLDASVTREHSGTGLGLAISRELTNLLGGTIRIESEPGKGATFVVELPLESPETGHRPLPSLA